MSNPLADIFIQIVKMITGVANAGSPYLSSAVNQQVGYQLLTTQLASTLILLAIGAVIYYKVKTGIIKYIAILFIGATIFSVFSVSPTDIVQSQTVQNVTQVVQSYVPIPIGG